MSVEIVLDPAASPGVVVVPVPGVVVIDNADNVTISDDYVLTIGD